MSKRVFNLEIPDGAPREFKVFDVGRNDSDKGYCLLTRDDMARVVAARGRRDVMIDLEHLSIPGGPVYNPDAVGWGRLEAREDGLWLVDVKWTDEGARRLEKKTQRYISPAFNVDDRGHVTEIFNIALTALPAMRDLSALVAANRTTQTGTKRMDPKLLEMLGLGADAGLDDALAAVAELQRQIAAVAEDMGAPGAADAADEAAAVADEAAAMASDEVAEAAEDGEEMSADGEDTDALLNKLASLLKGQQAASAVTRPMASELVQLSRRVEAIDRRDLMAKYGPRMTPALRKWCATQPLNVVRTFAESLPATGVIPTATAKRPAPANAGSKWSAADAEVSRLSGIPVEKIQAHRAAKFGG